MKDRPVVYVVFEYEYSEEWIVKIFMERGSAEKYISEQDHEFFQIEEWQVE